MTNRSLKRRQILLDQRGNVAAIAAAAVIPLLAMIGGGVDMGRGYMAKTQLQAACDAGALAGRRAMSASGEYGSAEKAKAQKMFDVNFDAAAVDATNISFETTANDEGQVNGTASAHISTAVMSIFGMKEMTLQAECMAELQVANTDVMFVLDTTGSMGGTRIAGLRDAVRDFHKTMNEAVTDDETRVRYGFVPYSMAVNAKELLSSGEIPTSYFVDSAPYETRLAQFNTPIHVGTTVNLGTTNETYSQLLKSNDCTKYGSNDYPSNGSNPQTSGSAPGKVTTRTYAYVSWVGSGQKRTCTRSVTTTETTYVTKFAFTNWRYIEADVDTSVYKTGAAVNVGMAKFPNDSSGNVNYASYDASVHTYADQAGYYDMITMAKKNGSELHNATLLSKVWNGCLEERDTVDEDEDGWDPVPDDAYDLDLDRIPDSDETRWRPMWDSIVYMRDHQQHEDAILDAKMDKYGKIVGWVDRDNAYSTCPSPMKAFTEVELSDDPDDVPAWLNTYLNGLVATGNTYHDIGMIWGGRLSSPNGIVAANVNKDDKAVSRHLIFMTDGKLEPYIWGYNSYGVEALSNRIAPKNSDTAEVTARHRARFLAACEAVKAKGITVWAIAFGTSLTDDLRTCSSDGRAYESSNTDELKQTFKYIASQVANLRLGK